MIEIFEVSFNALFAVTIIILLYYKFVKRSDCLKKQSYSKHVLITGCDTGFGFLAAYELNALEVNVYAGCLTSDGVKRLQDDPVFKGVAFQLDITKIEDIKNAYNIIKKDTGSKGLWCVINNAGIAEAAPIEWHPEENMRRIMEVNLWGGVNITKAMLPLVKQANGRIVNLTSIGGRVAFPMVTAYSMSKYAFEAFSDGLRNEMEDWNVSVHIIEPGVFRTPMIGLLHENFLNLWKKVPGEMKENYGKEYLAALIANIKVLDKITSSNFEKVINAICHATLSINPRKRYVIGFDCNTIWMAVATFPTSFGDFIKRYVFKAPIPAAVLKSGYKKH